jgi:hypothetical protein
VIGRKGRGAPLERGKDDGSLCDIADLAKADAVTQKDCEGDEAGEPEEHGQGLGSQNAKLVAGSAVGESPGHDDEVGEGEDGPDGAEDEEVDLRGRHVVPVAVPPAGDCCGIVSFSCVICSHVVDYAPYAVRPRTMMAKTPCAMRSGKVKTNAIATEN